MAHIHSSMAGETFTEILVFTDVASGLSGKRQVLARVMDVAGKGRIIDLAITHKGRLTRFGCGYLVRVCGFGACVPMVDGGEAGGIGHGRAADGHGG